MRGGHSEVAGGQTKVLGGGTRVPPVPRKRFMLGLGVGSPGVPESAYCQENPLLPAPHPTPIMACEPRFVLGWKGERTGWTWLLGGGVSPRGHGVRRATPSVRGEEGQGAGFPEIWGVPPLLKPPYPCHPSPFLEPRTWGVVGEKERPFRGARRRVRLG